MRRCAEVCSDESVPVRRWFERGPAVAWRELPHLVNFDAYFPSPGQPRDPYVDDGPGPGLLAMLSFRDEVSLRTAAGGAAFRRGLAGLPAGAAVTADALARRFYSAAGEIGEQALHAPFSYVVRYHRPAPDADAFVESYLGAHPPLLATLPQVRTVLCYVPIPGCTPNALPSADYIIGNEVAFDSMDHFNLAMTSPVRHELRRHYHALPAYSGRNTHYPMVRTRLA